MKTITYILIVSFITLTVTPFSLMVLKTLKSECEVKCILSDKNETCAMSDIECCPGTCNPVQCCFCCFLCTVDIEKLEIKFFETITNGQITDGQYGLSDFSSDQWQPPKRA